MKAIKIHPDDNVATSITAVSLGADVTIIMADGKTVQSVRAKDSIPQAHKLALDNMQTGTDVIKYGEVIGKTIRAIEKGRHVHVHNMESRRVR